MAETSSGLADSRWGWVVVLVGLLVVVGVLFAQEFKRFLCDKL